MTDSTGLGSAAGLLGPEGSLGSLDRAIHEPARLGLMAVLYVVEAADFIFLGRQTHLTAGNLVSHLSKLEAAGYVTAAKEFVGRRPRTTYTLTPAGREAFDAYRAALQRTLEGLPG